MNRDSLRRSGDSPESFRIVEDPAGPPAPPVLRLIGNLDAEGAPQLSETLEGMLSPHAPEIVLDFAEVDFISSSGIGALVAAIGECRDEGGDIRCINVSGSLRRVFEALDLLDLVHLEPAER